MRTILSTLLFLFILVAQSFSQSGTFYADSLKSELERTTDTLKKIEILGKLAKTCWSSDLKCATSYANKAVKLSTSFPYHDLAFDARLTRTQLDMSWGKFDSIEYDIKIIMDDTIKIEDKNLKHRVLYLCYRFLGVKELEAGDLDKALPFFQKSLNDAEQNTSTTFLGEATAQLHIGVVFHNQGKNRQAIEHYKKAINIARMRQNSGMIQGVILNNMAGLYGKNGNNNAAIENYNAALNVQEKLENHGEVLYCLFNIGWTYLSMDSIETSRVYIDKGIELALEKGQHSALVKMLSTLARIHIYNNELDSANTALQKSKNSIARYDVQEKHAISTYYDAKGSYFLAMKAYDEALTYYHKTLAINGEYTEVDIYKGMTKAYEGKGDWKKAYEFQAKYHTKMDSARTEKNTRKLADFEAELINVENEKAIVTLESEKELLTVRNQQTMMGLGGLGLFSLLILGFVWNLRTKNQTISNQNAQLDQLNQTKDRIFGIIGHDLKKPAIAFRGIAKKVNYLLKKQDYDRLLSLGESIEKDANSLNILTDNLLKWALLQRDILPSDNSETEIQYIVEEVFDIFNRVAEEKNIRLTSDIQPQHKALADKNALSTIIRNLVDNAVKFTAEGGEVNVSTLETKEGILVTIRDSGLGMNEDQIKELFLLKKEKTTTGTNDEKGTGLGLHLVGELIKQIKGSVEVNSQLGKGTEFRIVLPQAA